MRYLAAAVTVVGLCAALACSDGSGVIEPPGPPGPPGPPPAAIPSNIRIFNDSPYEMVDLEVGSGKYGTVQSRETTDYQMHPIAYRYNYVRATISGEVVILQPIDFTGEQPLGEGDFTYILEVNGQLGQLSIGISVERDP